MTPSLSGALCRTRRQRARTVEVVLVGEAPVARGEPGRKDEVTKLGRDKARVELAVEKDRLFGKGAYAALRRHELEGLRDAGPRQGIRRRVRPYKASNPGPR